MMSMNFRLWPRAKPLSYARGSSDLPGVVSFDLVLNTVADKLLNSFLFDLARYGSQFDDLLSF